MHGCCDHHTQKWGLRFGGSGKHKAGRGRGDGRTLKSPLSSSSLNINSKSSREVFGKDLGK